MIRNHRGAKCGDRKLRRTAVSDDATAAVKLFQNHTLADDAEPAEILQNVKLRSPSHADRSAAANRNAFVAAVTEPRQETVDNVENLFCATLPPFIFSGVLLGFVADVQQRRVYRRCRDSRIVIHLVSAATANAGAGCHSGIHRIATDALF